MIPDETTSRPDNGALEERHAVREMGSMLYGVISEVIEGDRGSESARGTPLRAASQESPFDGRVADTSLARNPADMQGWLWMRARCWRMD